MNPGNKVRLHIQVVHSGSPSLCCVEGCAEINGRYVRCPGGPML